MTNIFSLEGKNAWITGACYGIGFNIAKAFVEAGARYIIFNCRSEEALQQAYENYKEAGKEPRKRAKFKGKSAKKRGESM